MSMATISSLISQIHSVLQNPAYMYFSAVNLRVGLRNLNVLLVCLRNTGDGDSHMMQSLFSRIEGAIGTLGDPSQRGLLNDSAREVNCLAKEVNDEWYTDTMPNRLTLDDVAEIADSILHNKDDFCKACGNSSVAQRGIMDEFEVQTRFLRDFLLLVNGAGVADHQIQNLLVHVRPFVLDAARVFRMDGLFTVADANWVEQVQTKSPCVDLQVFECYSQTLSMSVLDQTNDDVLKDFLSSLISLLWHLLRFHRHPLHSNSLKALYEGLRLSRSILKQQAPSNNGGFEDRIAFLICEAGIVICSLYHADADSLCLSDLLQRFDVLRAQVPPKSNSLEANALDFGESCDSTTMEVVSDGKVQIDIAMENHQISGPPQVVGFQEDELTSILDRLTIGSKQLRLVPISGMAGLGKTTFALELYNHPSVIYGFQARAWCPISQVFDKRRVLIQLLNQFHPKDYSNMSEDDLANKLRQSLKGKRYLILLDDVWTPQVWESLRPSFPDDGTQSRILLTSRLQAIVPHALPHEQPHFLRLRKENECLEIIEMKLLHKVGWSTKFKKFAKLCKGLPLTAVLVAGLLSTTVQEGWEGILDHLSSGGLSHMETCKIALELSYKHLPGDLKLCFMYFGVFPEDEEIFAGKLIRLWVAEGFVAKRNDLWKKRIEDAQGYLNDLIQRNLVVVTKKGSLGGVKTCQIHDLLHDFCLVKGKQQNFFHRLLQSRDELSDFNETCSLERLSIHSTALHFKESMLFCPQAYSMLFFNKTGHAEGRRMSDLVFIIQINKLLKVLDMDLIRVIAEIPSEIALLTRLAYLSIRCFMPFIPSSIGNLSNLETLIIDFFSFEPVSLPHTIWDLHKLRYLHITKSNSGFSLPIENPKNSPGLLELEAICCVSFYSHGSMENQMRMIPNIRRLKCNIQRGEESSGELNKIVVVPEYLKKLELLTLCSESRLRYDLDFGCAESLKKVTLQGFVLSREEIAVIGKLPNLEVFKLFGIIFLGGRMEIEEGEFSKLRILILHETFDHGNLEAWIADGDEQLPCLEKLVFHKYKKLKEIPYCLETSSTLEEIVVSSCSPALEALVRHVEEVQKDFGNFIKVQY